MKTKHFMFSSGVLILALAVAFFSATTVSARDTDYQPRDTDYQTKTGEALQTETPIYIGPTALRQIQKELNQKGFEAGPVDGIWGPLTVSGIREFQKSQHLALSGKLNIETINSLGLSGILEGKIQDIAAADKGQKNIGPGAQLYISPDSLKLVQYSLHKQGFDVMQVDGIWGDMTKQSIRNLQNKKDLEATGYLTPAILARLGMYQENAELGLGPRVSDTEMRIARMEELGMNVETAMVEETEKATQTAQQNISESDRRMARMEAAGMDVESSTAEQDVERAQKTATEQRTVRGYYAEPESSSGMGSGAPLFAGTEILQKVQQALIDKGYDPGQTDGKWSALTGKALSKYQAEEGLDKIGMLTLVTLNKLIGDKLILPGREQEQE